MNKWLKFTLLYLGATLIGLSQLKIAPVINQLAAYWNISLTQISWMTSIFTLSGIFIAIPGGMLVTKIGAKKLLLIIMTLLATGSLLGTLTKSFPLLLFFRAIEGISFSTIVMTAVVLISQWFKDSDNSGLAIGIFTTFPASASLIGMNLFLPLANSFGLNASSYFIGGAASILIFLYSFTLENEHLKDRSTEHKNMNLFLQASKNTNIWLLGILQGCMAFVLYSYIALYPVIFTEFLNLSQNTSNFYSSLFGLFGIPFGVVAGYWIDKAKNSGTVILYSFVLMALATLATPFLSGNNHLTILIQVFVLSAGAMLASSSVTILVPKTSHSEKFIGYSMSIVNLFYYTFIVVGAPIISFLIENMTWFVGLISMFVVSLMGVFLAAYYSRMMSKSNSNEKK